MKINERIKQTRKRLGHSQDVLGTMVGVSRVSISQWERGENTPNGRYLNDLAAALGVSVDWLLTGNEGGESAVSGDNLSYMNVSERIKNRRSACGLTQDQLAAQVGATRVAVSHWERGGTEPKGRYINDLAAALGVSVNWLLTGKEGGEVAVSEAVAFSNVEPAVIPQGSRIPVISYVQAGHWREMCEQATAFDGNVEYVTAGVEVGPCGFGLWVRGDSMTPQFKEGDLIIVDPDEAPKAGDFVVASNGKEEATFKKYRSRGEYDNGQPRFELVPLNEDHDTLTTDQTPITIVGVVVEHRAFFKR